MGRGTTRALTAARVLLALWAAALVLAVCWPFLAPGEFLWRDMVVLHHMEFTPANFGGGDLPARATPQDGALALISLAMPATWAFRAIMVVAATGAAVGAWWLSTTSPAVAMAFAVCNPFVVERLLQGQWSLAVAAWLLPLICAAGRQGQPWVMWAALWLASLTPSGALLALGVALLCGRGHRWATAGIGMLCCLPWLWPSLLAGGEIASDPHAAVAAFAPRAEAGVGTLGALVSLGGLWNAAAIPASRQAGFALFGLVVAVCVVRGARAWDWRLATLAALGLGGALAAWLAQDQLAALLAAYPPAGLLRDSHKLVALAIPAYVVALGALRGRWLWVALLAVALQLPDAPSSLTVLSPRDTGVDNRLVAQLDGHTAYFPDRPTLVEVDSGGVAVDPYSKATAQLTSGQLHVDGTIVDLPTPRYQAAADAWARGDLDALEQLGIGAVVIDGQIVARTGAPAPAVPWALCLLWLLLPLLALPALLPAARGGSGAKR
ncbi:hypothetical protein G7Y31_10875 [Corynebacterium lizhenjunii]|uniref:Glycosyltransferase RgtA/B/C/D-like domain-containing protein n=1 Tax=Corynebacterium lizhenjunii TaxID=2709394 RepID=A0A7T0KED7_9CORY|nr:hypothetical protein [Corynebacterium lizhenjunii]QPK78989.1 hypothetical protein G7Y31_10875 [Corynebacterium lizhenjunii]